MDSRVEKYEGGQQKRNLNDKDSQECRARMQALLWRKN